MNFPAPEKLVRKARFLKICLSLVLGLIAMGAGAQIAYLLSDAQGFGRFLSAATGYPDQDLRLWQVLALALIAMAQTLLWAAVAWRGRAVFRALETAEIERSAHSASALSRLLWVVLIYSILAGTLAVLVITWHFPDGQRAFSVSFGSVHLTTVLAALIASFLSQALVLGAALWRDHQEVI